jgi:hypothetical protein
MIELVIDFMIILWVILMGLCIYTRRQFKKHSIKLKLLLDYVNAINSDQAVINAGTLHTLRSIVNSIDGGDEDETTDKAAD